MPYKSEKIKLNEKQDRRKKLTASQKQEIVSLKGKISQRSLARMFGVDRRTISFILYPEKLEENKKRRAERGGSKQYYNKENHTASMREHRKYKQSLYVKGELNE